MKSIAVVGAGIVGVCSAFFLQKSGFKVTLFDKEEPGTMTSFGHACTFADYANIPVNSPELFRKIPSMLFNSEGPLSVDLLYILQNLPWAFKFFLNCRKDKVEDIAKNLANILQHSRLSYEQIFKEVNVSKYIKNEENIYIYDSKNSYETALEDANLRKKNNIEVKELSKKEVHDLEPQLAPVYYAGQLFVGSRHTTNPLAITNKIFASFIEGGGAYKNENIKNVIQKENSIEIIFNENRKEFDEIVIAAGAWSNIIAKMIGENFPLDTERGYHVLFETSQKLIDRPIGWSQSGFYLIQIEDGIRAAGTVEIAGLKKPPNIKRINMIEKQARSILPQLGKVKSTWLGRRPTLPDAMPVIGRSTKNKNVLYAFGHQHIGWTLAAVTGMTIDKLAKNSKPNFNIDAFSPSRFD